MKVRDIMNKAYVVEDNISLKDAAKVMSDKNIGSLIVMRKDEILGIITEKDIIKNVDKIDKKISNFMTKEILMISEDDSIEAATELMAEHKIKRLPVVKKDKLVGIVTATDILANSDSLNEDFIFD
jgi:CBS domain-containing protein